MTTTLIIPGLRDSGPEHWQTWLQKRSPGATRVAQADWGLPDLDEWSRRIAVAVETAYGPPVLVAHSFGVLAAVRALSMTQSPVAGAMLVAPADPETFGYANLMPPAALPTRAVLVASRNDPWMAFERAASWAVRWGARFVDHGYVAHINVDSGHGPWPAGERILHGLLNEVRTAQLIHN
jgi:uncharacterized protein